MATLYIRESDGAYRPAQEPEVLSSASELLGQRVIGQPLTDPALARDFLRARLAGQEHEIFGVLFLDQRHRALAFEELFRGALNGTAVYPREVVKRSLAHNAAAVILVHNHPSGNPEPSRADEVLTTRLREALLMVDIRTLDHLVIGRDGVVSFSERGLL
ncbi:MAG: RadC family protein [Acidobacteriaceae bacterium]